MTELAQFLDVASKVTIITGLLVIIWGGIRRMWVFGWLYQQVITDYQERLVEKDKEIAELKAARQADAAEFKATNQALNSKVDTALDTLGDAVRLLEAGPQQPARIRSQGGSR